MEWSVRVTSAGQFRKGLNLYRIKTESARRLPWRPLWVVPGPPSLDTMSAPTALSDIEIQRNLGAIPGWSRKGDALVKSFHFATFPDGVRFIAQVAEEAERLQHHPDIDIRYTRVQFQLSTHDAGGITAKDFELATAIEALAAA